MEPGDVRALMREQLKLSRELKARVRELEGARSTPLAVVGTALRLPGGLDTPERYWDFLLGEREALSEIPEDRPGLRSVHEAGPGRPGTSYVDRGGFLRDVAGFDPDFFGISRREADALDPQQRLLLEVAWEAMERAGIAVRRQERLAAGVFVGIMTADYTDRLAGHEDRSGIDPYYGTGGGHAMAAGRIGYALGLSGPAISVDTACSSSLVALHLAARSLRGEECRYALVGGANIFFSPDLMVSLCQSKALAPDGRSKAFLDSADGYGRGEGVGMLVLMRLADAEREGRPIHAVLRGSAVNHDGASSGLTVPCGPAQQEVLRAALADADVSAGDVGYVEAHGTGTALGDPIEAGALDAVLGSGAPDRGAPVAIGSVKARIGHLESAAGIAALIKVVLMLRHHRIPASATEAEGPLNHLIPWDRLGLTVPRTAQDWPAAFPRHIAGVSAFGMSGTNAHALLESYRPRPEPSHPGEGPELLTLSARHPDSLKALAVATAGYLTGTGDPDRLASVCATLRDGRTAFEHRIAVTGRTPAQLAERLTAAAQAYRDREEIPGAQRARLRFGAAAPGALEKGLAALRAACPGLADDGPGGTGEPRVALASLLKSFGLRVTEDAAPGSRLAELVCGHAVFPLLTDDPDAAPGLLADLLGAVFRAGADLRFDPLRAPGTRYADDLPTYAFRRRRCWIDEPLPRSGAVAPEPAEAGRSGQQGPGHAEISGFLLAELAKVMHSDEELDLNRTFLDVGGDSFTAMQFTIAIEERYRIEIPLDELVIDLPLTRLLEGLTRYIAQTSAGTVEAEPGA